MASYIHDLLELLRGRFRAKRAQQSGLILGVAGGVAAGKTTFADMLASAMQSWPERPGVAIVSTDGFLFPNKTLADRQLSYRKGFPESFDVDALTRAILDIRTGRPARIPVYSHVTYDVDPAEGRTIESPEITIIDGLHLRLAKNTDNGIALIDPLIYLDADEGDLEHWFRERLFALMVAGRTDSGSFYHQFRAMDDEAAHAFVTRVWTGINLPNLREHIIKDRDAADVVVRKSRDHSVSKIVVR